MTKSNITSRTGFFAPAIVLLTLIMLASCSELTLMGTPNQAPASMSDSLSRWIWPQSGKDSNGFFYSQTAKTSSGDTRERFAAYISEEGDASYGDRFIGNKIGDYIEYSINFPSGGTYLGSFSMGNHPNGATFQASIDGTAIGAAFNTQGSDSYTLEENLGMELGSFAVAGSGTHKVRFTVTGGTSGQSQFVLPVFNFYFMYGTTLFSNSSVVKLTSGKTYTSSTINTSNVKSFLTFNYKAVGLKSTERFFLEYWNGETWVPQGVYYGSTDTKTENVNTGAFNQDGNNPEYKFRIRLQNGVASSAYVQLEKMSVIKTSTLVSLLYDSFESGSFGSSWANNGADIASSTSLAYYGKKVARLTGNESFECTIPVDANNSLLYLSFYYKTTGANESDLLLVEYWNGAEWKTIKARNGNTYWAVSVDDLHTDLTWELSDYNYLYPTQSTGSVKIRFSSQFASSGAIGYIDNVIVTRGY